MGGRTTGPSRGAAALPTTPSRAEQRRWPRAARVRPMAALGAPRALPDAVLERIRLERRSRASLRPIAAGLNADDMPTLHGGRQWHASTVRAVLGAALRRRPGRPRHARGRIGSEARADTWVMLEIIPSRAAWDEHMRQPYITEGNKILEDLLREPSDLRLLDER